MEKPTTIKLLPSTKERMEKLRVHKRETYDEILQRILNLINLSRTSPEKARIQLVRIERKKRAERKIGAELAARN